ncbi:hypothetical protein MUCCIDRAFT_105347 [Mucor lusitanicus CBS 277.49]|uniref:TECPR1-like DysF domain-containing protein n=1 Tax=Mucor lusitanicus CBS 277.49 TaxID=747725 RepID=A0A162TZS0_MUCCL|nr:hypothetical protein MUCCIDRAFT_105347 [Mucor lusitanicus CBS 277.49]
MFNVDEGYCTIDLKDADKIPPLVLNMLIQLGPAVKYMALFTDVLMWKNPSASVLAVLLWITLCTWTQKWLVFGLPCLCFVKLASNWLSTSILRRRREASECSRASQLGQDLNVAKGIQPSKPVSMHDTVHHLQQIQTWWFSHCQWRHLSSYANQQVAHYLLIYIWPLWAALNFILGSHGIFALAGTWFLVASSPWYQLVLVALKNNPVLYHYTRALLDYSICLFTYLGQETHSSVKTASHRGATQLPSTSLSSSSQKPKEGYRCEVSLLFEIYQNQRYWFGLGWTESLLQSEREPWTDNQLKPIISKDEYKLPKETRSTLQDLDTHVKRTIIKSWVWTDRDWWIDMTGELEDKVDRDGWQYGDNGWLHLMKKQLIITDKDE